MSLRITLRRILSDEENINLWDSTPLLFMHVMALSIFFVKFHWLALVVALLTYGIRMFAITGGYHRYFSHRTFKTSRPVQFALAWLGASAAQNGPLWWASHHRHHHLHSDTDKDLHSPKHRGFVWAHIGWVLCRKYARVMHDNIKDFAQFPELRFIDRFHVLPTFCLAGLLFGLGTLLGIWIEGVSGLQFLAWGFFFSTVLIYHATFCINSLTHVFGSRRFRTSDTSRNNFLTALLTMGEGWHNNHHRYPKATRQGFYWWEIDLTWYLLQAMAWIHLIWDLQPVPASIYREARRARA